MVRNYDDQVYELLQQMENFDGVMVAATNFSKNLDAAVMRLTRHDRPDWPYF